MPNYVSPLRLEKVRQNAMICQKVNNLLMASSIHGSILINSFVCSYDTSVAFISFLPVRLSTCCIHLKWHLIIHAKKAQISIPVFRFTFS